MQNENDAECIVLMLLARALIDIRAYSLEKNHNACHALADLFHNVPYQINTVRSGDGNYENIIEWIQFRSEEKRMQEWVKIAMREI